MKTCILIPVHNEARAIGGLVERLRGKRFDVLVIDDGSEDGSGAIAQDKGAIVLRNEQRSGKGFSLQRGFTEVVRRSYDAVIVMDGDGQHDVDDIPQFIEEYGRTKAGVISGNRMSDPRGMPFVRLATNRIMSGMISAVCRQRVPDTQCGFRFIHRDVLSAVHLTSSDFEIESEVLIKASKKGFKISSVPIRTIYDQEVSKIRPVRDTVRFFLYLTRELFSQKS